MIEKFARGGGYEDAAGCWYEDAESLVQCGVLGMCGCGSPEANLRYVYEGLKLVCESRGNTPFTEWFNDHCARSLALHGGELPMSFFHYWLDKEGYVEHGGCLPGWLTVKGEELLALLCDVCEPTAK